MQGEWQTHRDSQDVKCSMGRVKSRYMYIMRKYGPQGPIDGIVASHGPRGRQWRCTKVSGGV